MIRILYLLSIIFAVCSCNQPIPNTKVLMYIGTSTDDSLKGIEYCYFDTMSGQISQPILASKTHNPNFLEIDTENNVLLALSRRQQNNGNESTLNHYHIDTSNGQLTLISEAIIPGQGPCYVALDKSGKRVMVANYSSGEVCAYTLDDGKLNYLNSVKHYGSGPNKSRQDKPYAHSIDIDPQSDFIYAADLGADKLMVYKMTNDGLVSVDSVMCAPGAGPRHFDFSPDGKILAVINELNCTVTTYAKDHSGIYRNEIQSLSLKPDTFVAEAWPADIHFSADGKFLYASNRGFNCIAVFQVNGSNLQWVEFMTDGINWPRNFTIDPSGNYLLSANRDGNNISVYKRNKENGKLTMLPNTAKIERPFCIKFHK